MSKQVKYGFFDTYKASHNRITSTIYPERLGRGLEEHGYHTRLNNVRTEPRFEVRDPSRNTSDYRYLLSDETRQRLEEYEARLIQSKQEET